jgi:hypothetical protein
MSTFAGVPEGCPHTVHQRKNSTPNHFDMQKKKDLQMLWLLQLSIKPSNPEACNQTRPESG